MRTSGRRVQNSTRKPEVADDIMYSACVQIYVILRMSIQCVREGVHCGVTMETLTDRVPVLPAENYPNLIPEENATRLSLSRTCHSNHDPACKLWNTTYRLLTVHNTHTAYSTQHTHCLQYTTYTLLTVHNIHTAYTTQHTKTATALP